MERRALLIGCPGQKGTSGYLHGVLRDLENYGRFLRSPLGGAWYSSEITTLEDPPASTVLAAIRLLETADYSFALFSGHGYVTEDGRSTMVCLRSDEEMDSIRLRSGAKRHTLLIDCCRVVERSVRKLAEDTLARIDAASRLSTSQCRHYFEKEILACSTGLIVLHSCKLNETSGDDSARGGYYAHSLIDAAEAWLEGDKTDLSKEYARLWLPRAHDMASEAVQRLTANRQNPEIEKPRSEPHFPFAIIA